MADHSPDFEYIKRMARLIRQWCADNTLSHADEQWMIDCMIDWLWRDPTCSRRLRAAGLAQGVDDRKCIASDYLGEVLARNPNALAKLMSDVLDARDAVLVSTCRRSVVMRVQNLLYHRWKESDAIGASIEKALWNELCNRPDLYVLLPDSAASPKFVTTVRDGQLRTDRPIITPEEMLRLIAEVWKGARQIPACVRAILRIVADDHQWCALVPIHDVLFNSLCEAARQGIMRAEELRYTSAEISPDVTRVLKESLVPTMQKARELLEKYVRDGKLTPEIANGMYRAVGMIFEDLGLSGDRNVDHARYVQKCCPDIAPDEYRKNLRSKFEYVMRESNKTLKKEFRNRWGEDSANPENDD